MIQRRGIVCLVNIVAALVLVGTLLAVAPKAAAQQSVRLIAEDTALPYIYAGLNWYRDRHELELSGVPLSNLHAKTLTVAFSQGADAFLSRYSSFVDMMKLEMFTPLNDILPGEFAAPNINQSDLILYKGEVVGVCFGPYTMSFLHRPCIGVFSTSPRKAEAAHFITVLKDEEPVDTNDKGELKRIAESFFASLFYVEDYESAFTFLYSHPTREGEWTLDQWVEVMATTWLYRRVDAVEILVDEEDVSFVSNWVSARDGRLYPEVAEVWATAVLAQDPNYVALGRYPVTYLLHWVPVGDEWKVLSAPYHLFE